MGWGEPTSLKFDVDKIRSIRRGLQDTSSDLTTLNETLRSEIEGLKKDWNTPAGQKFRSSINTDWSQQVEKYVRVINLLDELLGTAEADYAEVETLVNNLSL